VLTGLLDRSARYGVLAEIEALGLDLLEVRQLEPHRKSPESGNATRLPAPADLRAAAAGPQKTSGSTRRIVRFRCT